MHRPRIWSLFLALLISLVLGSASAWAHSVTIDDPYLMELGQPVTIEHSDQYDWKGTLTLTVTNTGDEAWGDFHFYLPESGSVVFGETSSMSGVLGYALDFSDYALDFYFYEDPIETGESAMFYIYTDNTALPHLSLFSITMEASPVPVPATAWLLGAGLTGLIGIRRRQR
ncbi:exported hypothetical protein [Desulfosarcina cetonica]|uniref:VPLPA-CTERM sorting domain-containing protein n=1 Tax=Desulfosarcina cetonica TaxID=90730 RepID=UPI0006D0F844|nr:VPLPA-CTERM sorting domain-containing protein [Desulfosarcina cetonica]VTR67679.1 exported hypothetical protein [Desulfosarcina cetonica]